MNEKPVIALATEESDQLAELNKLFTKIGFTVIITATTGDELLGKLSLASTIPKVCIISTKMSPNGGLQLAAEIKSKWHFMKIIITSFSGAFISKMQSFDSLDEQLQRELMVSFGRATFITKG